MNIIFIGAGNLATHLSQAFQRANHRVLQVYSRTEESASSLAALLDCPFTTRIEDILPDAEVYVFSVRDAVLQDLAERLYAHLRQVATAGNPRRGAGALFVHTAGSMPLDVLPMLRRGVFYPMQTFSKSRHVDFCQIPIFLESQTDMRLMELLARALSQQVYHLDGERRRYLHLSAVFACNFVNHCYDLAGQLLQEHGIPFDTLLPLIDETARKVHELSPRQAQTGPAVRYDENVINAQSQLLNGLSKDIYDLLSRSIHERSSQSEASEPVIVCSL